MSETKRFNVYFDSELGFEDFQTVEAETEAQARDVFNNTFEEDTEIKRVELAYNTDSRNIDEVQEVTN